MSIRSITYWGLNDMATMLDMTFSHAFSLTHSGRVTHICFSKLTIIGSDNCFSPGRRQAIIWTNAGIMLIGPLATNFSEILIEIFTFSFKKMHLKMSSGKWRPYCLGLNVLKKVIKFWLKFHWILSTDNKSPGQDDKISVKTYEYTKQIFSLKRMIWKCCLLDGGNSILGSISLMVFNLQFKITEKNFSHTKSIVIMPWAKFVPILHLNLDENGDIWIVV